MDMSFIPSIYINSITITRVFLINMRYNYRSIWLVTNQYIDFDYEVKTKIYICYRKTSTTTSGEEELNTSSEMNVFDDPKIGMCLSDEADSIQTCANQYKLKGKSIGELCEHNASIAASVGRPTVITYSFL